MAGSIWKGSISFGLLNIPVTLQSAQSERELHFSLLDKKDLSRIKYLKVSAKTGEEVPSERIVKGYEYQAGRYVVISENELKKANVKATQTIDIEDFVLLDEVEPMFFDRPYYLVPQKGAEKGYYLLRDALEGTNKVAVGKVVIRVKQHLALIMPRGPYLVLELLRFAHDVKTEKQVHFLNASAKKRGYSPKELRMAEDLVEGMTSRWSPEQYKDTYYQDVMKVIQRKVRGGQGHKLAEPRIEKMAPTDNVIDLMPLLQKSLLEQKKHKRKGRARA